MVNAHHITRGVLRYFVKAALIHPVLQVARCGSMGVGQVGDGEFAALGKAGVAVLRQALGPVPHQIARLGRVAEFVVEPDFGNAVDVAQALGALEVGVLVQAARQGGNDLSAAQAQATRPAHRQDEGEAKARVVGGVELLDAGKFFGCAIGQARFALFVGGLGRQGLANHGLARQLGVGADQGELGVLTGLAHYLRQRQLEVHQAGKRALRGSGTRNPGGMFVSAVQQGDAFVYRGGVDLVQCQHL